MTGAMSPDEALAVSRLRQWAHDRIALRSAKTVDYQNRGWQARNDRCFDARLVRVIDFGRALATLDGDEQAALIFKYRDRCEVADIAIALHCSARRIGYLIPSARRKLAARLDTLNLL
jgi:DNA-directed RNA polymerase specialized sigma24 family protein